MFQTTNQRCIRITKLNTKNRGSRLTGHRESCGAWGFLGKQQRQVEPGEKNMAVSMDQIFGMSEGIWNSDFQSLDIQNLMLLVVNSMCYV